MARCDHNTAVELIVARGKGYSGSGKRLIGEADGDVIRNKDISSDAGERRALEAVVVADNDAARGRYASAEIIRDSLCDNANVFEGEGISDDASPAVGTKFNYRSAHEKVL